MENISSELLSRLKSLVDTAPHTDKIYQKAVLLIEDDPVIIDYIREMLSEVGFHVIVAHNGEEAVALFSRFYLTIRCVILDFDLHGMHPARALSKLQEIDRDVKVLLSSGYPLNHVKREFPLERVKSFILKPFDSYHFISELEKLLT